jgi:hypothetical protein
MDAETLNKMAVWATERIHDAMRREQQAHDDLNLARRDYYAIREDRVKDPTLRRFYDSMPNAQGHVLTGSAAEGQ